MKSTISLAFILGCNANLGIVRADQMIDYDDPNAALHAHILYATSRIEEGYVVRRGTSPTGTPANSEGSAVPQRWNSYTNEEFGLKFQYPPSLTVIEDQDAETQTLLLRVRVIGSEHADPLLRDRLPGYFEVDVFSNPREVSVEDWLDTHGWPFGDKRDSTISSTQVSGTLAHEVTTGKMMGPNRYVYLVANGLLLRLAPIGSDSEAIMNSFRLLEPRGRYVQP